MEEDDIIGASRSAYESKLAGCTEGPEFVFQKKAKQRKYIYISEIYIDQSTTLSVMRHTTSISNLFYQFSVAIK